MRLRKRYRLGVPLVVASVLLTGCSSDSERDDPQTIEPATAAVSPTVSAVPAGLVELAGTSISAMTLDSDTGIVAALTSQSSLLLIDSRSPGATPRPVDVDSGVTVTAGRPGEVLVPGAGHVDRVDVRSGAVTTVPVDGDALSAQVLPDGRLAVGTASGAVQLIGPDASSTETIDGLSSADALATVDGALAALDKRQTSLTELDLDGGKLGLALRAGEGATNLATDHYGRILVTDTTGGELLVFTADSLVLRQRYPVGTSPYAVTYDNRADIAWVTLTATNEVVGYNLASGSPVEVARWATVRQPNSVVVDSTTGELLVGSATGDGLQRIGGRT